jgi:hypothetical protein
MIVTFNVFSQEKSSPVNKGINAFKLMRTNFACYGRDVFYTFIEVHNKACIHKFQLL